MKFRNSFPLVCLLFLTTSIFCFQNTTAQNSFDSIYKKISFYSKQKKYKKAIVFSRKLYKKALDNKDSLQQAKLYHKIAGLHRKLNSQDSAFYYYNKSKEIYLPLKDSMQLVKNLFHIALIESDFGSYAASDSTAVKTLKYLNGRRPDVVAAIYNCLGINLKKQFFFKEAIPYFKKALENTQNNNSKNIYKNNLANVYKEDKNYLKAISVFKSILKDSIKRKKTKARVIDNLAHIKWLYNSKNNVLDDLLLATSIREKEKDKYGLIASYSHLSDYFKNKNKVKSLFYANKMYVIAKSKNATNGLLEAIDKIVLLEKAGKSILYLKESIFLRDSLQKVTAKRQYKFAKIKYNYEEEERQKLQFKNQAIENKLLAEKQSNQKKNIFILTILSTSGLLFYSYRRKQQHKKELLDETYNTELRISKKLHDELGNGLYNIITKVQNPSFKRHEIVNDLDKVYLQTRKISHESDSIETGKNFESYFRELITSYNSDASNIILKDLSILELNTLKKERQVVLYRVFNELFVNMKKHSQANLVVISCKKTTKFHEIIYIDNGVGFKNEKIILKNGLKNVETRILSIGGSISFEHQFTKGCKIIVRFKK